MPPYKHVEKIENDYIKYSGTLTSTEREKGAFSSNKIIRVIFLKLNLKLTLSGTLILGLFNLVFMSEDCR